MTTLLTMKGFNKQVTPLCFTANKANSTVRLLKSGFPTSVTLETSTDGINFSSYTIEDTITLSNVGDKVYFRNTSETTTGFSTGSTSYYGFVLTGSVNASGDITSLINKNCTDTLSGDYCFFRLFYKSSSNSVLKTAPKLLATTLTSHCYQQMFCNCAGLTTLPKLPATTLKTYCYYEMFRYCSNIKLSSTQTGDYQTEYRIPTIGTGTSSSYALSYMFSNTGGTFTSNPTINTTYYTSNQVI